MTRRKHPPRPPLADTVTAVINELDHPTPDGWRHNAPCRGLPTNIFYPPRGQHTTDHIFGTPRDAA